VKMQVVYSSETFADFLQISNFCGEGMRIVVKYMEELQLIFRYLYEPKEKAN
jgi:hypothetical protein